MPVNKYRYKKRKYPYGFIKRLQRSLQIKYNRLYDIRSIYGKLQRESDILILDEAAILLSSEKKKFRIVKEKLKDIRRKVS